MARVLLLGYAPENLDFSDPAFPPGMTVEKVHGGVAVAMRQFAERGWEADVCLIQPDETAGPAAERQLASKSYDCVVRRRAPGERRPCIIRSRHQRYS